MGKKKETKKTKKVRWICDKPGCRHYNVRIISEYHVIFEDICSKCGRYCHEPITRRIKD